MKNLYYCIIFYGILILFSGCANEDEGESGAQYSETFVQVYTKGTEMNASFQRFRNTDQNTLDSASFHHCIRLHFKGEQVDKVDRPAEFKALSRHFVDTTFRRDLVPFINKAYANEFVSVDLVSDQAFDAAHPAGTSLGDIAQLYYITAWPFVSSGYRDSGKSAAMEQFGTAYWNTTQYLGGAGYTRVIHFLNDLTPADLKLIDPGFMGIRFTVAPQETEHNLTLTVKDADRTYRETMKASFVF